MTTRRFRRPAATLLALAGLSLTGCGDYEGPTQRITVPSGATFGAVADTLAERGIVPSRRLFVGYARIRGDDRGVKSGQYQVPSGASWNDILAMLTEGRVVTVLMTVPEGFTLAQIAPRIAQVSGVSSDSVQTILDGLDPDSLDLPGPGLEGYLFPDTYRFAPGVSPRSIVERMARRYRSMWTPARRAALDSLEMTERELVTLASIIQAEARVTDEMPTISSVYHRRLNIGMRLQADPTVLYALGGRRDRLLFAAIDSVADSPYNTYTQPGLPPGPIGAPGEAALEAALAPADEEYLYFVARPDGSHVFTRSLAEHNRAVAAARRAWDTVRSAAGGEGGG